VKIDVFCHIVPAKYKTALEKVVGPLVEVEPLPTMFDLNTRFRVMDKFDDLMQVLTISLPPLEIIKDKKKQVDLAKLANDEMAELINKHPDRFAAAVACLPMGNMEAALMETDRAMKDLKFRGVQIFTPFKDKPLDSPELYPLYEKMCQYNLPIWIHPWRESDYPDYRTEKSSRYGLNALFGWVYESSMAMLRLIYGGVLEKYPNIKFITHHGGAMVPFLEKRVVGFGDFNEMRMGNNIKENLRKPMIDYLRMFYVDTAINGNMAGLKCSYNTFGSEHVLFGTDFPYDTQWGIRYTKATIDSIETMEISDVDKKRIFEDNVRNLLRLPV
jgi:aminocarboxymuconate-semialdehyde decarboxylase